MEVLRELFRQSQSRAPDVDTVAAAASEADMHIQRQLAVATSPCPFNQPKGDNIIKFLRGEGFAQASGTVAMAQPSVVLQVPGFESEAGLTIAAASALAISGRLATSA